MTEQQQSVERLPTTNAVNCPKCGAPPVDKPHEFGNQWKCGTVWITDVFYDGSACPIIQRLTAQRDGLVKAGNRALHDIEHPEEIHPRSQHILSLATQQLLRDALKNCEDNHG